MEFFLFFLIIQAIFIVYHSVTIRNLKKSNRIAREKTLSVVRKNERLVHSTYLEMQNFTKTHSLPTPLLNIPFADQTEMVLNVKKISFAAPSMPYNASIGLIEGRHHLFFRYDLPSNKEKFSIVSQIGSIQLDNELNPINETFCKIDTHSEFSEDPRFFQHENRNFLVYSDLKEQDTLRKIRIGEIHLEKQKLENVTVPYFKSEKMEKNWTPFSHEGEIHFVYAIDEQKIFSLPDPQKDRLCIFKDSLPISSSWIKKWGALRGGTPALLVDGEYLSFFHSSFEDQQGIFWYVMGAYTFQASPPFKITRISPHPILFEGIYDIPHQPMANPKVRSLYPAGLVIQRVKGKDLIVVSCGENDSGIKLITIDKNALFATLQTP